MLRRWHFLFSRHNFGSVVHLRRTIVRLLSSDQDIGKCLEWNGEFLPEVLARRIHKRIPPPKRWGKCRWKSGVVSSWNEQQTRSEPTIPEVPRQP